MTTNSAGFSPAVLDRLRFLAAILIFVVAATAPTTAPAASASFQGLGIPSLYASSRATGVSADGSVAVGYACTASTSSAAGPETQSVVFPSNCQAFRWTAAGGMALLGFLSGYAYSYATAVSADGAIVVGYGCSSDKSSCQAFRWTAAGGVVGLGFVSGYATKSYAWGVSGDGSIVTFINFK